ncbi:MAG: AAA family ATPase [Streptosporangiales bacterium]|nr:AAA family ATPase [Streptosporangiales bacterium]
MSPNPSPVDDTVVALPPRKHGALVRMSDVKPEHVDWVWPGRLARGKLHVLDGDPGLGKSTVTVDWAARVTTGKPWPDGQAGGDPAGVVLISVEDGLADVIRPRLDAAGADLDRVVALTDIRGTAPGTGQPDERLPELPTDVDVIRDALLDVNAALLVIDPLMACLAGSVNAHRDQDIRRALAPLVRVAEETHTAVVIVRHLTKGDSDKAIYRGGGSIGIIGAARLGYTVARHPEEPDNPHRAVLAGTKANITTMPASLGYHLVNDDDLGCAHVEWEGTVDCTANDLLRPTTQAQAADDPTTVWLRSYLAEHGDSPFDEIRQAAEEAGIAERTLRRAGKRAGVLTQRAGFPACTTWRLPTTPASSQSGHRPEPMPDRPH